MSEISEQLQPLRRTDISSVSKIWNTTRLFCIHLARLQTKTTKIFTGLHIQHAVLVFFYKNLQTKSYAVETSLSGPIVTFSGSNEKIFPYCFKKYFFSFPGFQIWVFCEAMNLNNQSLVPRPSNVDFLKEKHYLSMSVRCCYGWRVKALPKIPVRISVPATE